MNTSRFLAICIIPFASEGFSGWDASEEALEASSATANAEVQNVQVLNQAQSEMRVGMVSSQMPNAGHTTSGPVTLRSSLAERGPGY